MDQNKICINIDWYPITDNNNFSAFTQAQTGYPLIDAGVRQLLKEGWVHHIIRYVNYFLGMVFFKPLYDLDTVKTTFNWTSYL